jgi:hypothetical protein
VVAEHLAAERNDDRRILGEPRCTLAVLDRVDDRRLDALLERLAPQEFAAHVRPSPFEG